jgi:hypothetical protein
MAKIASSLPVVRGNASIRSSPTFSACSLSAITLLGKAADDDFVQLTGVAQQLTDDPVELLTLRSAGVGTGRR